MKEERLYLVTIIDPKRKHVITKMSEISISPNVGKRLMTEALYFLMDIRTVKA